PYPQGRAPSVLRLDMACGPAATAARSASDWLGSLAIWSAGNLQAGQLSDSPPNTDGLLADVCEHSARRLKNRERKPTIGLEETPTRSLSSYPSRDRLANE